MLSITLKAFLGLALMCVLLIICLAIDSNVSAKYARRAMHATAPVYLIGSIACAIISIIGIYNLLDELVKQLWP